MVEDPGEVLVEPYIHDGPILRKDFRHVSPPAAPLATFHHIAAVDSIVVVEYTSPSAPHSCSVLTGNPI